jgi:hypothetical protein
MARSRSRRSRSSSPEAETPLQSSFDSDPVAAGTSGSPDPSEQDHLGSETPEEGGPGAGLEQTGGYGSDPGAFEPGAGGYEQHGGDYESVGAVSRADRAAVGDPGAASGRVPGMIPTRRRRSGIESFFMRSVATAGIVGIGTVIAAIMAAEHSAGWIVGLVVSIVSVVLAAILWSSQRL